MDIISTAMVLDGNLSSEKAKRPVRSEGGGYHWLLHEDIRHRYAMADPDIGLSRLPEVLRIG